MSTTNFQQAGTASSSSNVKVFKKSFFAQYGILFALVPLEILLILGAIISTENRLVFGVTAVVGVLLLFVPFLQVGLVKVEPNKLTIETFFEQKVLSAKEIKEIKVDSVRGRYGRVTHMVNVIPVKGKNYPIAKFQDSTEVIYEFLTKWWNYYRGQ